MLALQCLPRTLHLVISPDDFLSMFINHMRAEFLGRRCEKSTVRAVNFRIKKCPFLWQPFLLQLRRNYQPAVLYNGSNSSFLSAERVAKIPLSQVRPSRLLSDDGGQGLQVWDVLIQNKNDTCEREKPQRMSPRYTTTFANGQKRSETPSTYKEEEI